MLQWPRVQTANFDSPVFHGGLLCMIRSAFPSFSFSKVPHDLPRPVVPRAKGEKKQYNHHLLWTYLPVAWFSDNGHSVWIGAGFGKGYVQDKLYQLALSVKLCHSVLRAWPALHSSNCPSKRNLIMPVRVASVLWRSCPCGRAGQVLWRPGLVEVSNLGVQEALKLPSGGLTPQVWTEPMPCPPWSECNDLPHCPGSLELSILWPFLTWFLGEILPKNWSFSFFPEQYYVLSRAGSPRVLERKQSLTRLSRHSRLGLFTPRGFFCCERERSGKPNRSH